MTFHSVPKDIGMADTLIFECPATLEGSVHGLMFENYSAGSVSVSIKLYKHASGFTSTVRYTLLAAGAALDFGKINVQAGDKVLAAATSNGAIRALANAYVDVATPAAVGFTPRGTWLVGSNYAVNDIVEFNGSSYIARVANTGSQPPSANWMLNSQKGDQGPAGSGAGDMQAVTYDPDGIGDDVFDMDNMKETTTRKILSNTERTKLSGIASGATANDTDSNLKSRANHTGTQAASTITGLATVATTGSYNDLSAKPTLGTVAALNTGTGAGNVPVLDSGGLLNTAVLPAIAITDVFEVASQAAMLALTAQKGDIAIRTDLNKTFALSTNSPATLADWKELRTPTDVVLAVAGLTGTITAAALKTALAITTGDVSGLGNVATLARALVADVRAAVADKVLTAELIESAAAIVTLTDAATIALDWDTFLMGEVTLTANRAFGNPTNVQPGTTRYVLVKGSSTTPRTMSFGSNFKGNLPTDTVTTTAWVLLGLTAYTSTHIVVTSCKAL